MKKELSKRRTSERALFVFSSDIRVRSGKSERKTRPLLMLNDASDGALSRNFEFVVVTLAFVASTREISVVV